MSSTFIAGFDGSDGAREAVRFATHLARALEAEVVAVTGYAVPPHIFGKGASDGADAALADDARAEADRTLSELHEDGVAARVTQAGTPAQALIEKAQDDDADLIVIGTHHPAGPERLKLSSTAGRVVHGAPCPVAIVPSAPRDGHVRTIAVAYDGREPAETALEYGAALARALSARLVLMAVVEQFPGGRWERSEDDGLYHDVLAARADAGAAALPPELEVEVQILTGVPGEAIVDACKDGIDVLVTGSRAYGPVRATLVGGVSHYLAAHAPCPVIVVPRQVAAMPAPRAQSSVGDGA
jgi:nucleotide-binding universal stress UspA family protein